MPARSAASRVVLDDADVDGLGALVPGLRLVLDARALGQRAVALADDPGVVHEEVLAGLVGRDEAEALVVAEPLHGSGSHCSSSSGLVRAAIAEVLWKRRLRDADTACSERGA